MQPIRCHLAMELIKEFEGFNPRRYRCPSGVWTIGYGRTTGELNESTVTTVELEDMWLSKEVEKLIELIEKELPGLNDYQYAALASFVYNVGFTAFYKSMLFEVIKTGDRAAISFHFKRWNKGAGSNILPGLIRRREREVNLYFTKIHTFVPATMKDLLRAAINTKPALKHQQDAWNWLEDQFPDTVLEQFMVKFRSQPSVVSKFRDVKWLSQRANKGDWNGDGKSDHYQTCQVTSVAMVLNSFGILCTPKQVDTAVRSRGDRYTHSVLSSYMKSRGVKTSFDTGYTIAEIKNCLGKGGLAIWSNRLTHSGHVVVIQSFSERGFRIYDPWGEPMIDGRGVSYIDKEGIYNLSYESFDRFSSNGLDNDRHWAHLVEK